MSKLKKFSFLFHEMFHSDMFIYNLMLFMLKFIALIFTFLKVFLKIKRNVYDIEVF